MCTGDPGCAPRSRGCSLPALPPAPSWRNPRRSLRAPAGERRRGRGARARRSAGSLRDRARARPRRHGDVYLAQDLKHHRRGRAQGPASRARARRSAPSAFCARSRSPPGCSIPTSSRSTTPARPRAASTTPCPTSKASRSGPGCAGRAAAARRRAADRPAGGGRPGLCPRPGVDPPRHQAGEHPARATARRCVADFGIARAVERRRGGDADRDRAWPWARRPT